MTTSNAERQDPATGESRAPSPDQGWFVAAQGRQYGPLSAAQAWELVTGRPDKTPIHVWHPSLPAWKALTTGAPSPGAPEPEPEKAAEPERAPTPPPAAGLSEAEKAGLQLDDFRLANALLIACLACAIAPIFVLGAAIVRDIQEPTLTLAFVAFVAALGWWVFLEQAGVRLEQGELSFPSRIPLWPYPAFARRRLKIDDISGFECWAQGYFLHWFRLHAGQRPSQVLLDNALHREILKLALERRLPQLAKPA